MYGFQPRGSFVSGIPSMRRQFTQTNAVAAAGDTAMLSSGVALVGTATSPLIGIYEVAATSSGTAKVNVTPFLVVIGDNDQAVATFASTHVGTRFDITGTTGAQQVDTDSSSTSGQLVCLEFNTDIPPYAGDASIGVFMIAEHQLYYLT